MVQLLSLLAGLALICATSAVPLSETNSLAAREIEIEEFEARGPSCESRGGHHKGKPAPAAAAITNAKAVYFITNAANNSVVALKVNADGSLSDGSVTATGGAGMSGVLIAGGAVAAPDALFSQGAVKVAGNMLVAVNPGSNTISMFTIDAADATKLTMVGQPADTLGEFPMSVSLSAKLNQACVANSGAKAGIACFSMSATEGLKALDTAVRPFNINQTTPPAGPENTVSQTFFNEDSTALLTTVKGNPAVNNTGFLSIFPVVNNTVSTNEARSSPNGTAVLFGTALIPNSKNVFVTDASFGSATLAISSKNIATVKASTKILDQKATCWAAISDLTKTAFVTDVANNHLVEIDVNNGNLIKELNSTNGNPGMIDLVSAGKFIYALSPGNATVASAVTVFDVSGGRGTAKEVQNFKPAGVTSKNSCYRIVFEARKDPLYLILSLAEQPAAAQCPPTTDGKPTWHPSYDSLLRKLWV
ncbi:hypothetical protein G7Y89_g14558 [Cudoniella acicularis]|uniref:3-carboxymuconate cyclase n=1 Tax=Cudoniella acicularis TaxID=354080 RepID=A0A8H4R3F8_9HELO|nr:hypothetical protein G7Y89_g14558 [Cudoniella acicularis]